MVRNWKVCAEHWSITMQAPNTALQTDQRRASVAAFEKR
jgi:hypothetical protein